MHASRDWQEARLEHSSQVPERAFPSCLDTIVVLKWMRSSTIVLGKGPWRLVAEAMSFPRAGGG